MVYDMENEKELYENEKELYEPGTRFKGGVEMETVVGIGAVDKLLGKRVRKSLLNRFRDVLSDIWIRIKRFFYWRQKPLDIGELKEIPVDYVTESDLNSMSRKNMACVKTKSGVVVVTPQSAREIRKNYKDASIVDSFIK